MQLALKEIHTSLGITALQVHSPMHIVRLPLRVLLVTNNIAGCDKGNIESCVKHHVHLPYAVMVNAVDFTVRHGYNENTSHAIHQFRD